MQSLPRLTPRTLPTALFLDFDGTLVDLADQPELVHVPAELVPLLTALHTQLDGALAVVSGRRIVDIDTFLAPLELPAAGEHGARRRDATGALFEAEPHDLQRVIDAVLPLAEKYPGLRLERKEAAVALHYRHAPELEALCRETLEEALRLEPALTLLHGKFVFEAKPLGVSKGSAIEAFMREAPFAGRQPVFAGDDVTDEAGFEAVRRLNGLGIKVGLGPTMAQHRCASPAELFTWMSSLLDAR